MSSAIDLGATVTGADKVVVIALGNRFRGDDGIGPIVAERLKQNAERLKKNPADRSGGRIDGCTIVEGKDDAMALVSAWENAALAVVIDAAVSGAAPGTIRRLEAGAQPLSKDVARCSSHGLGLAEAVELGKALGRLPGRLVIFAVEAATLEQGVAMSPQVAAAADTVVRDVEAEVASFAAIQDISTWQSRT
jgi:hydrogenase maturation protease